MFDKYIELLKQLGFVDCGDGVWQRKTPNTNLIVSCAPDKISIWHGSPSENVQYASSNSASLLWLESEITRAALVQMLGNSKIHIVVTYTDEGKRKDIVAVKATKEEAQKAEYRFAEFWETDIEEWTVGEEVSEGKEWIM